jgi:hypothetical protein
MPIASQKKTLDWSALNRQSLPIRCVILFALFIMFVPSPGCSKEEMKQKFEEAKAKTKSITESAVQAVEERLPETGHIALEMTPPVEFKKADLELISIGDGRPNVVRIVTYDPSAATRSYPSLMLQGTTTATSPSALAGETVACDMYYQSSHSAPIAMTTRDDSISVKFGSLNVEDNALPATLGMAGLVGSDDKPVQVGGGDLLAVIRGEGN